MLYSVPDTSNQLNDDTAETSWPSMMPVQRPTMAIKSYRETARATTKGSYVRLTSYERSRRYCPTNNSKRLEPTAGLLQKHHLQPHIALMASYSPTNALIAHPVSTGRELQVGRTAVEQIKSIRPYA